MANKKRFSWTELFLKQDKNFDLNKDHVFFIDNILYQHWALGKNIILAWALNGYGIDLIVVPHCLIGELAILDSYNENEKAALIENTKHLVENLITSKKMVSKDEIYLIGDRIKYKPINENLPFLPGEDLPSSTIENLVRRYSLSYVDDRAVALFDCVDFSRYPPLLQATQLNSLAYSVNTAYSKLLDREIEIRFARTTTGDGFYVWNRSEGIYSNVDLYHFMHLVLADDAIARRKSTGNTAPLLRTSFHVGGHYEFYQSEGLYPTTFSYIVGDVTIELARMLEQAKPGQILIGDFNIPIPDDALEEFNTVDAVEFIRMTQHRLSDFKGLSLGGDRISKIRCYLTGSFVDEGFNIHKYLLTDKHGFTRYVFNAKVNIHRDNNDSIFLGLQNKMLSDFGIADVY